MSPMPRRSQAFPKTEQHAQHTLKSHQTLEESQMHGKESIYICLNMQSLKVEVHFYKVSETEDKEELSLYNLRTGRVLREDTICKSK